MDESKEFPKCPVCELRQDFEDFIRFLADRLQMNLPIGPNERANRTGLNRLCEGMANEVKGRGLARPGWTLNLQSFSAVAIDPSMAASIPIGSEVPAMRTSIDICTDCGCVYATRYDRGGAKKEPTITRVSMPVRSGN